MVVADAAPVWVAHIRGSPAACVCVCVCVWRRRQQTSSLPADCRLLLWLTLLGCIAGLRADCRLLLWLTLLGCIADLAGAAPA